MNIPCVFDHASSMKKTLYIFTLFSIISLSACTEEEINNFFGGDNNEFTVSGKTVDTSDTDEPDVTVEGVYTISGGSLNPAVSSDTNGDFSLQLTENDSFYLRASKSGFVAMGTKIYSLSGNASDIVIEIPTETEAQDIINAAFSLTPQLVNHAWLIVDVTNTSGDETNEVSINLSATPAGAVYTACDGIDSGAFETTGAPCSTDRSGPMYIAYYDSAGEVIVSVGDESQTAAIRMGEITSLGFELP